MNDSGIYYSVGALLYSPANNEKIVQDIACERFGRHYSLALCLEDTIRDDKVKEAEQILITSFDRLYKLKQKQDFYIPKIFIRVRQHDQIPELYKALNSSKELLLGFIVPKFSSVNCDDYIKSFCSVKGSHPLYIMPIIESGDITVPLCRLEKLCMLKEKLDEIEPSVLNIRVGGNDLLNYFGLRRRCDETIYDILPVSEILSDILSVFSLDYVVSGVVWEYYNGTGWENGLKNELRHDIRTGFIGKTVIHPNQIDVVNRALRVSNEDYNDAMSILNWNNPVLVSGSTDSRRMNEYKTHYRWAKRIMFLAENYGIEHPIYDETDTTDHARNFLPHALDVEKTTSTQIPLHFYE